MGSDKGGMYLFSSTVCSVCHTSYCVFIFLRFAVNGSFQSHHAHWPLISIVLSAVCAVFSLSMGIF